VRLLAAAVIFALLALFLGESILAFLGEQLDRRRAFRLELAREQTRRVEVEGDREALVWRGLERDRQQPADRGRP
jgi:type II secretory pathway pseudopilin PulG